MTAAVRTLAVLLGMTVIRLPLAALLTVLLPDPHEAPAVFCVSTMAQSALMFGVPGLLLQRRRDRRCGGTRLLGWLAAALLLALAARGALSWLNEALRTLLSLEDTPLPMPLGAGGWLLAALAYAVIPALCEEVFFRGALLGALEERTSPRMAALLTTLLFALLHGSPAGLPGHVAIGLLLTLAMQRSGRLAVPALMHMVYNLLALQWPGLPGWLTAICGAAALAACVAMAPGRMEEERKLSRREKALAAACLALMCAGYITM